MSFFEGSRYLRVREYTVLDDRGREVRVKRARLPEPVQPALTYQVRQGDRPDLLAHRFFRTPRKWWLLCDANPEIMHPDQLLEPGRVIRIPRDRAV